VLIPAAAPAGTVPGTGGPAQPASDLGNPFRLADVLGKLDAALAAAISEIGGEQRQVASSGEEDPLVRTLRGWQAELAQMQRGGTGGARAAAGSDGPTAQEGGLYTD
jgi:hypothetical protein